MLERFTAESREWQEAQRERAGFGASPELCELGNVVYELLRSRGYGERAARWASHAVAVPTRYNWQGNPRLASHMHRSKRTAQRGRLELERAGLIASYLLSPGDKLEGQRAPVRRFQVVRDVERLQLAGRRRLTWLQSGGQVAGKPARPEPKRQVRRRVSQPASTFSAPYSAQSHVPPTAAELRDIASRAPDWLANAIADIATATAQRENQTAAAGQPKRQVPPPDRGCPASPPNVAPPLSAAEIDEIERELMSGAQRSGLAPPRGS